MDSLKTWRPVLNVVRYLVTGGLLVYLIWIADPAKIWDKWRSVNIGVLLMALMLQFVGIAISSAKWGVLLRARGQHQPYSWLVRAYLVGQFANNFLPTGVGGDAVRAFQLSRRIGSLSQASASVFLDRLTGFLALTFIANGALVLATTGTSGGPLVTEGWLTLLTVLVTLGAVGAVLGSLGAPWLLTLVGKYLPDALRRPLETVTRALADYFPKGRTLVLVLILSLLFQSLWVSIHLVCGLALGFQVPVLIYALMATLTDILGLLPVFVNNMGARELVFTLYLSQIGLSTASALAIAFLVLSVRVVVSILGGVVLLVGGDDLRASHAPPGPQEPASHSHEPQQ